MTIYSLDVLLFLFGTSLFHVQFWLLTIWWCPCVESSCDVGRVAMLLWPVSSLARTLLAFTLLHSYSKAEFACYSRCFLTSYFCIPVPKKGYAKECSNYHTIILISHTGKVMLKIFQARLQQHMNRELPHVQASFRKRGIFQEISIETCILSRVTQITSPGWMHETSARTWCTGKT